MNTRKILEVLLMLLLVTPIFSQTEERKVIEIFTTAEQLPMYPGCYNPEWDHHQMDSCTKSNIAKYLSDFLEYPEQARKIKRTGTVVVQFVVNKKGILENFRIIKGLGYGCDEEAIRMVSMMNERIGPWSPGKQRGVPIEVLYTMPIQFKL